MKQRNKERLILSIKVPIIIEISVMRLKFEKKKTYYVSFGPCAFCCCTPVLCLYNSDAVFQKSCFDGQPKLRNSDH